MAKIHFWSNPRWRMAPEFLTFNQYSSTVDRSMFLKFVRGENGEILDFCRSAINSAPTFHISATSTYSD